METPQEPLIAKRGAIRLSPPRAALPHFTSIYAGFNYERAGTP